MLWDNICPEIYENKTNMDYFINEGPFSGVELVLQDLVGLGQPYYPLHMDPLGGDDPIPDHSLCWQLIQTSHSGWGIHLDVQICE